MPATPFAQSPADLRRTDRKTVSANLQTLQSLLERHQLGDAEKMRD